MISIALALVLAGTGLSGGGLAGGPVVTPTSSGGIYVTGTTAPVALFVSPTGSDSNACTATGTAACLTTQGALNKVPKLLRHGATITHACGTYAGATISGFTVDPSIQHTTAGLLIDGALSNVTPATGSATGTATAGSAGSGTTFGTLTDSSATWTVNDPALVGKFIVTLTGTGSGQTKVIVSNTATALTIVGPWTAPANGTTYAIQSPCVVFTTAATVIPGGVLSGTTGTVGTAVFQVVNNSVAGSSISFRNININPASGGPLLGFGPQFIFMLQTLTTTGSGAGITATQGTTISVSASSAQGAGNAYTAQLNGIVLLSGTLAVSTGLGGTALLCVPPARVTAASSQLNGTTALVAAGNCSAQVTSVRCDCASAANSVCLLAGIGGTPPGVFGEVPAIRSITALDVTNCTRGVMALQGTIAFSSATHTFTGNALTYAADAVFGGSIMLPSTTPAITAGTAEISVDNGAATTTFGTLAATYSCLTSSGTTSRVCRQ